MATDTARPPPAQPPTATPPSTDVRILVADDDREVSRSLVRLLKTAGYEAVAVPDGNAAVEAMKSSSFDLVLSDIHMPGTSGVDLLRLVRAYDLDVPVILMTGDPEVDTALDAVELGALGYLRKPLDVEVVMRAVSRAVRLHRLARAKRAAVAELGTPGPQVGDLAGLHAGFERALASLWMAFQPIVDVSERRVIGYEALLRTREPTLPDPYAVLTAAERLGRLEELGRRIRERAVVGFSDAPRDALLFVNLHMRDLLDPDLSSDRAPLARLAPRVVLEITERASLEELRDLEQRVEVLRFMDYRVALDDLGSGYAGLTSFARLEPEFVKMDMTLIRGVEDSPIRQQLIRAMVDLCKDMGTKVIAEGVETAAERRQLVALGCHLMQGFLFAAASDEFVAGTAW